MDNIVNAVSSIDQLPPLRDSATGQLLYPASSPSTMPPLLSPARIYWEVHMGGTFAGQYIPQGNRVGMTDGNIVGSPGSGPVDGFDGPALVRGFTVNDITPFANFLTLNYVALSEGTASAHNLIPDDSGSYQYGHYAQYGDVFGFAVDRSTGELWIRVNSVWVEGKDPSQPGLAVVDFGPSTYPYADVQTPNNSQNGRTDNTSISQQTLVFDFAAAPPAGFTSYAEASGGSVIRLAPEVDRIPLSIRVDSSGLAVELLPAAGSSAPGFSNDVQSVIATKPHHYPAAPQPYIPTPIITVANGQASIQFYDYLLARYTLDGSMPTENSPYLFGPVTVPPGSTFRVVYQYPAFSGPVGHSANYTAPAAPPQPAAPAAPTFSYDAGSNTLSILGSGFTPVVYYTTDGSVPTAQSTPYNGPFNPPSGATVKAVYVLYGGTGPVSPVGVYQVPAQQGPSNALGSYGNPYVVSVGGPRTGGEFITTANGQTGASGKNNGLWITLTVADATYPVKFAFGGTPGAQDAVGSVGAYIFAPGDSGLNAATAIITANVAGPDDDYFNGYTDYQGILKLPVGVYRVYLYDTYGSSQSGSISLKPISVAPVAGAPSITGCTIGAGATSGTVKLADGTTKPLPYVLGNNSTPVLFETITGGQYHVPFEFTLTSPGRVSAFVADEAETYNPGFLLARNARYGDTAEVSSITVSGTPIADLYIEYSHNTVVGSSKKVYYYPSDMTGEIFGPAFVVNVSDVAAESG